MLLISSVAIALTRALGFALWRTRYSRWGGRGWQRSSPGLRSSGAPLSTPGSLRQESWGHVGRRSAWEAWGMGCGGAPHKFRLQANNTCANLGAAQNRQILRTARLAVSPRPRRLRAPCEPGCVRSTCWRPGARPRAPDRAADPCGSRRSSLALHRFRRAHQACARAP